MSSGLTIAVLVGLALALPLHAQSYSSNPDAHPRGDRWDPIRAVIKEALDANATASISLAVAHHGQIIWEEGFGIADRERGIAASPRVPYSLASLTKPFTATALMQLVEQNKVRLDSPINDYLGAAKLKGFAGPADGATVRRVLSHTAGLPAFYRFFYDGVNPDVPSMDTTIARYGILVTPPGSNYQYSNLGYRIIGSVIERVSGKSYAQYMHDAVFAPLGLADTSIGTGRGIDSAAVAYGAGMKPIPFYDSGPGASAIWASAHDVVRFGMFHLKNHLADQQRILTDATIDLMQQPHTPETVQGRYGLGWIPIADDNGYTAIAHAGGMPGVATVLVLFPEEDVAIAVLTNGESGLPGHLVGEIAGMLLPKYLETKKAREANEQPPPAAAPFRPSAELLGEWKGSVRTYSGRVPLALTFEADGEVHVTLGNEVATVLSSVEFDGGELVGYFNGQIPTDDAQGFPRVLLRLHLRGPILNGMARAQDVEERIVGGLPSYVELEKVTAKHQIGIGARLSHMPIQYDGRTLRERAWAGTVSASYIEAARNVEVQVAFTVNPKDTESLSPSIQLGSLTMAWWPGPTSRIAPFVGGGVGVMRIVPVPYEYNCGEPFYCEEVPSFRRATLMTVVGVGGVDVSFGRLGVRLDARGHMPLGSAKDDTEDIRWDVGVGLRYFF